MIEHYTLRICCVSFLFFGLHLYAQADSNSIQRVDAESVPIIRLKDESHASLSRLWSMFKTSPSLESKRVIGALITDRPNNEISDAIDKEMSALFAEEPIAELALLLGMCSSGRSRKLLEQFVDASDTDLSIACRLALARRGDKASETFFLKMHEKVTKKLEVITDRSQIDAFLTSRRKLEYIGSAECILAIFDGVGLDEISFGYEVRVTSNAVTNMLSFLHEIGVSVPSGLTGKDLARWWIENRDIVGEILRKKEFLPRLKKTRIIKAM